jgi:hypothetical protein
VELAAVASISTFDVDVDWSLEGRLPATRGQRLIIEFGRRFGAGNGAVRKWGARLAASLRPGPIDYDYHGLTLRMDPSCGSTRHMLMSPYWSDRRERSFILGQLPENGVFVDIGANAGFYTFFAAGHRRQARIVAFEPVKRWAAALAANARLNLADHRVSVENVALSDEDDAIAEIEGVAFSTTTLLAALLRHNVERIDALKIDIEGMEDRVLLPFFRDAPRSMWPKAILGEHLFTARWRDEALRLGYAQCFRTRFNSALVRAD